MTADWLLNTPVIVGVGECVDRPADPAQGKEPLHLMADALRRADADAGGGWLAALDRLEVVNSVTWGYVDLPRQLAAALGIAPGQALYGPVGGESPLRHLNDAALAIANGSVAVAAIAGAEAAETLARATKQGIALPWTPEGPKPVRMRHREVLHPSAFRNGLTKPLHVYPIYDYASAASWGQTPAEARRESAELWSVYAQVAARNEHAWIRRAAEPESIATPTPANRMVAGPYTKLMVANPTVNQGGAILLTSLSRARAAGIPDDRLVFLWGGAAANEPRDFTVRDQYERSGAMDATLEAAQRLAGEQGGEPDLFELYSCFPCVPKMARWTLGLPADREPTVAGGLTFFGAPLNNYMTHAAAAMVRALRERRGTTGLLYGQGEYVTKHHALIVADAPPVRPLAAGYSVQAEAERRRGPAPAVLDEHAGPVTVESFTVVYDRGGAPEFGVVFARTAGGERVLGRVDRDDPDSLAFIADPDRPVVGVSGTTWMGADGLVRWAVR